MNKLKKLKRRIQYATKRKMWPDVIRHGWLVRMCYTDMYALAGVSFDELVNNATLNERGEKDIPFDDYSIPKRDFYDVLGFYQSLLKENYYKQSLSNQIHLGCSPKITDE